MKIPTVLVVFFCSLAAVFVWGAQSTDEETLQSIFNGKDLSGWDGDPKLWSVVDGAITGTTTEESPLPYNKFLIWTGGTVRNFELRLKLRLIGDNNSGIQYRSRRLLELGEYVVGGYQTDIHPRASYHGMLYEEKGRGIIAQHGQRVIIDANGNKWQVGTTGPILEVNLAEWNEYTIVARGNRLIHKINGHTTVDVVDHQIPERSLEGVLAFQVHRGPAMQVQIKDVLLKILPGGGIIEPDQTPIPADAIQIGSRSQRPPRRAAGRTGSSGGEGWSTLFNGRDLSGWSIRCPQKDRALTFWRVVDGTIECNSLGHEGHDYNWLMSDEEYGDFHLKMKFQVFEAYQGNSGVQFRSRYDTSEHAPGGAWLDGPQVDIHPSSPLRTGLIYDETREVRRWIHPSLTDWTMVPEKAPKRAHETRLIYADDNPEAWNDLELICRGTQIRTLINGHPVADFDGRGILDDTDHRRHGVGLRGFLALQLHRNSQTRIRFKDIRIRELN